MEIDLVHYYFREKLYHEMLRSTELSQESDPSDLTSNLYIGVAHFLNGQLSEALDQLQPLTSEPNIALAALLASIHIHKQCKMPDKEAIYKAEQLLKDEMKLPHETALLNAADILFMVGKIEKARDFIHRLMKLNPESLRGLVLKGWIELTEGNKKIALSCFRAALAKNPFCVDAVFGEVKIIPPRDGLSKVNQLIVRYPELSPPLVEKMRLHLSLFDWQLTIDTANRILTMDPKNLTALKVKLLYQTCFEGNYEEVSIGLGSFSSIAEEQEPQNWKLLHEAAVLFSRTCGRDRIVLASTECLLQKALSISCNNLTVVNEVAHQYYLSKKYKDATKVYRSALKINESCFTALAGLTLSAIAENGVTSQTKQQVDFLIEIAENKHDPDLLIMQATCQPTEAASFCDELIDRKFQSVSSTPFGCSYLAELNPDLLFYALSIYPDQPVYAEQKIDVLRKLSRLCPGLVCVWSLLAVIQTNNEFYDEAMKTLKHITNELDPANSEAFILMAKIHKEKGNFSEANINLELALSYNLKIREKALFHLLNGILQRHRGDVESSVNSLKNALSLNTGAEKLNDQDLASLYIELSSCYKELNQFRNAKECLSEAAEIFEKSKFEPLFIMSNADLALLQNNVATALSVLASITADQPYFINAQMKMAEIHLKYNKDGHMYAECYRQLAKQEGTAESFVRLADAYLTIQEPEKAVESYEIAVKLSADPEFALRSARVLVKTHQYAQAVKRYRESGEVGSVELGTLLVKLGELQAAENCLANIPLTQKVFVLAEIAEKNGDLSKACKLLSEALEQCAQSDPELGARICKLLAEYSASLRDFDNAVGHYKRWLSISSTNSTVTELISVQISLAKLYLQVNDWKACEDICSSIVSKYPNNEPALLMMADLAFRRCDFSTAETHFNQLISRHPTYFVPIARLIEVKRRLGLLHEAKPILDKISPVARNKPGFNYCLGLYNWYSNNYPDAKKYFNLAQFDSEWGQQALHNMVEICLIQPDIETAQKLLSEMKPSNQEEELNCRLLQGFVWLSSKNPQKIDKAMTAFTLLVDQETMKVGATLGLSMGYIQMKQSSRAKSVLKRIAKVPWQFEEAEHLEKCWLMLADLHLQSGKYELTSELLKKILSHNLACAKAYEYYGLIGEKDQKYLEASAQYAKAWELSGKSDLNVGSKLAMNLLKAKQNAHSVDVCLHILNSNSEFPRLRKDVLEKAIGHLKT